LWQTGLAGIRQSFGGVGQGEGAPLMHRRRVPHIVVAACVLSALGVFAYPVHDKLRVSAQTPSTTFSVDADASTAGTQSTATYPIGTNFHIRVSLDSLGLSGGAGPTITYATYQVKLE